MNHWATPLIGLPYSRGGRGPDAFDCLGFFDHVQRTHYGVQIAAIQLPEPLFALIGIIDDADERRNWIQVDRPQDGDAVLMARNRRPVHIGVWVNANGTSGVLHCAEPVGVVFQNLHSLKLSGWGGVTYYRRLREN